MKSILGYVKACLVLAALCVLVFVGSALAQNVYSPVDPCNLYANSTVTIPVAIATASPATTQLIAAPSAGKIWLCSVVIQPATTSSVKLNYGTGTACATGNAALTGALTAAVAQNDAGGNALGTVPALNALCATVTGTGGQGYITYVVK